MQEQRRRWAPGLVWLSALALASFQFVSAARPGEAPFAAAWSAPVNLSNSAAASCCPLLAIDDEDTVHAVWQDRASGTGDVYYASKPPGGSWSAAVNLSGSESHVTPVALTVDDWGTLHLLWRQLPGTYYLAKPRGGTWSAPVHVYSSISQNWQLVAAGDTLHAVWEEYITIFEQEVYYASMRLGGAWSTPTNVSQRSGGSNSPALAADGSGTLHLAWLNHLYLGSDELLYAARPPGGPWSPTTSLPGRFDASTTPRLAVDGQGTPHLAWPAPSEAEGRAYHTWAAADGAWQQPQVIEPASDTEELALAFDQEDRLHLLWLGGQTAAPTEPGPALHHATWAEGAWSPATSIPGSAGALGESVLALDRTGMPHVAWTSSTQDVTYAHAGSGPEPTPEPASGTISAAGGSLVQRYPGHSTRLQVPPGALSASEVFTISYQPPPDTTGALLGLDHFFELEGTQTVFSVPVTVTVIYSDRGSIIAGTENLYWWQGGQWVTDGLTLAERLSDGLTAQTSHLSLFGVLGETNRFYLPLVVRR